MTSYEENILSEQPDGYGPDFKPIKKRKKVRDFDPMTQRLNLFGEGAEDDLDESRHASAKVFASNTADVLQAMAMSNRKKLAQAADAQGRVPAEHANMFKKSKQMAHVAHALHFIGEHPKGEALAKEALSTSTDSKIDGAQIMKTAVKAGIKGADRAAMDYQRLAEDATDEAHCMSKGKKKDPAMKRGRGPAMEDDESFEEADGGMYHRSKRNRMTRKRGRGSAMAKDYEETQPDTLYNYEQPTPQFSHDMSVDDIWESTEHREFLQFWLDEALEEHGFEDSYRSILRAIDEAVEEDDFETFDLEVARLCESLGILAEYKKMSGSARRAMARARKKPKSAKEKMALKKRREKYKRSASMRRKAKMYRKKNRSRMDSEDYEDNLTEQPAGYGSDFKPLGMSHLIKMMGNLKKRRMSKAEESLDEQLFGSKGGGVHFDVGGRFLPVPEPGSGGGSGFEGVASIGLHQDFTVFGVDVRANVDYGASPFGPGGDDGVSGYITIDLGQFIGA